MSKLPDYRLSKKKVNQLLKDNQWKKHTGLFEDLPNEIYELEDGRILLVDSYEGTAVVYESLDSLKNLWQTAQQEVEKSRGNAHILAENFPYQENFIAAIPTLIDQLAERFSIPRQALDNSLASLKKVDKAIKKTGQLECLKEDIFPSLIAYVGEVIKQRTDGRWQMRSVPLRSITVWEPLVIDNDGREYLPFYVIYKELYENLPFSLEGAVTGYSGDLLPHCLPEDKPMGLQGKLNKTKET